MKSILLAALVAVAGCGGLVVFVEEDGGQGGTGQGGQPSTSSSPMGTPCEQLCFGTPSCETKPGCLENCESNYTTGCEAEADAFFQCQFDTFDPVDCAPDFCAAEGDALHECQDSLCGTSCEQGEFGCTCSQSCEFQIFDVHCSLDQPGFSECECQLNGNVVGTCTQSALNCDPGLSCCAQFFAQDG